MAKYRLMFQEEKDYPEQVPHATKSYLDTTHEVSTSDPNVMAATLRSIADSLIPPKPIIRQGSGMATNVRSMRTSTE